MKNFEKDQNKNICAVDYAFQRIGGKYKGRILWRLYIHKVMRYSELKKDMDDISTKMLTQTLRELESDDVVTRKVYPEVPPKVEYSLTKTGKELIPFIEYLFIWASKQLGRDVSSIYEEYQIESELRTEHKSISKHKSNTKNRTFVPNERI